MKFGTRAAALAVSILTAPAFFSVTAWAQSPAEADSSGSAIVNVVRFLGIALGFLIAFATTRFIAARAEKNRTDIPQAIHVKSEGKRVPRPTLVCRSGPLGGKGWPLEEGSLTIGREETCSVRYPKDTRSIRPQHCRLTRQGDTFLLTPLADTRLGEEVLTEQTPLAPDTPFFLGEKRHEFRIVMQ